MNVLAIPGTPFALRVGFPSKAVRFADVFSQTWKKRFPMSERFVLLDYWSRRGGPCIELLPSKLMVVQDSVWSVGYTSEDAFTLRFDGEVAARMPSSTTLQSLVAFHLTTAALIAVGRKVTVAEVDDRLLAMGLSMRAVLRWLSRNG